MRNERKRTDAGAAKGKRKISFLRVLIASLAVIVLIQGTLPISVLALSDVKGTLEGNAISIDARAVDNRKVNLESAMVKSWAGISRETVALNSALSDQLAQSGLDVPGFLADDSQKEAFIADAFP